MNVEKLSKTGNSVYNDEIRKFLAANISSWFEDSSVFTKMTDTQEYIDTFLNWIKGSQLNKIKGLESFSTVVPSLGVTQALDQFHYDIIYSGRTMRVFRGEYPYNRDVLAFNYERDFIDDRPLEANDAVILSCPFSASGRVHPQFLEVLDQCQKLKIPLFLDMAWFGTCAGLEVDLSHPAITAVSFSLTKGLTCGNYRSGIRLSRSEMEASNYRDRLFLQHEWNHGVHLNCFIGTQLMKKFGADTQAKKYQKVQGQVCQDLGLEPSLCVHIATSEDEKWSSFDRDGFCKRINIRELIKEQVKKNN